LVGTLAVPGELEYSHKNHLAEEYNCGTNGDNDSGIETLEIKRKMRSRA